VLAKGARRAGSPLRASLLAFRPLVVTWAGRGEVRTLVRCEWLGGHPLPAGERLLCGFYLNELLLRLLPREDAHEQLFDYYAGAVSGLAGEADPARVLRAFERRLLQELGYALTLDRDAATGAPIEPERACPVPIPADAPSSERGAIPGRVLLALAREEYDDPATAQWAKQLMRMLIDHRLDRQPLHSRAIFRALQNL